MEYTSLTALLGLDGFSPDHNFLTSDTPPSATAPFGQQFANAAWPENPQDSQQDVTQQAQAYDVGFATQNGQYGSHPMYGTPATNIRISSEPQLISQRRLPSDSLNSYPSPDLAFPRIAPQPQPLHQNQSPPQTTTPVETIPPVLKPQSAPALTASRTNNSSMGTLVTPPTSDSPISVSSTTESAPTTATAQTWAEKDLPMSAADEIYKSVTKPYDYTESYHFLMKFLPTR